MRFQVSQVMDAIEQRLTTDVTGAQAVVDLGEVVRHAALDGGRPVNLVRIGMVIDALSRYLLDGGAMLYAVAERALLSEAAFTSKERMVLSRWADDGLIETTPVVGDRAVEVADLIGVPLIAVRRYPNPSRRFGWLDDAAGRVLYLTPCRGTAVLSPMDPAAAAVRPDPADPPEVVVGRAKVPTPQRPGGEHAEPAENADEPSDDEPSDDERSEASEADEAGQPEVAEPEPDDPAEAGGVVPAGEVASEAEGTDECADTGDAQEVGEPETVEAAESAEASESAEVEEAAEAAETEEAAATEEAAGLPVPIEVFADRDPARVARVRVSRHRFLRAEPNGAHASVLAREWRCHGFDCPAFGEYRQIGQPVPRMRGGVPVCPRHDEPVTDVGPRPSAYPLSIVVDELPRRRLIVRRGRPLPVGRADDDPDVVSVAPWLHQAAADWISPVHLRLEAGDDGLVVVDVSDHGTVVWRRTGPDAPGTAQPLYGESCRLGEWDSVELYTGIELVRADRRLAATVGPGELESVLVDAPTAAHRQVRANQPA